MHSQKYIYICDKNIEHQSWFRSTGESRFYKSLEKKIFLSQKKLKMQPNKKKYINNFFTFERQHL